MSSAGGTISQWPRPEGGTGFELQIPEADAPPVVAEARSAEGEGSRGETILVPEEEEALRRVICRSLERAGYVVIAPATSVAARDLIRDPATAFDLLLTDLIMPEVSGEELVRELEATRPRAPALFMSGYAPGAAPSKGAGQARMLGKPFLPDQLVAAVRLALAGGS